MTQLVGRSMEWEQLDSALRSLGEAGAPVVVDITGEAGSGKSRLLGEVCAQARRCGLTVLRGRATEYERHTPFQAFADAFADMDLTSLDPDPALAEAWPLLRGACGDPGSAPVTDVPDRFRLHRAIAALLARLGENGLVMAIDDLHWGDPASLELVDHLVRHPAKGPVLLVLARRNRQTPTPLTAALTRGADSGAVLCLRLGPLPERESIQTLASDLPPDHAKELYAASEGNPLYLLSLLHAYRHGARWRDITAAHAHAGPLGVPSGLASLMLDELTALTEPQRRVAEAVAVLGDQATPAMVSVTTGFPASEVRACTSALARRDLLRSGAGGPWVLRHPLLRALVYEDIESWRRAELHRRAADELARTGAGAVARAHHVERSLTAWDPSAAALLSEAAAQHAHTAPATAAHLLDVVLRILPDTPGNARRRGELMLSRARALGVSGHLRESRRLLHTVISTLGASDPSLRAEAVAQCAVMERHLGHSPEATALLRGELARSPGPPPGQAVSLGLALGMSALLAMDYPSVRADMARTLALARSHGGRTGEVGVLALAALGETYEGETEAAGRFADAAARLADGLIDPNLTDLCEALVWLAWAEAQLERFADAERHADRGLDIARRSGQLHVLPHLLTTRAYVHLQTCRLPSALESVEEAESVSRAIGSGDLLTSTLACKSLVLLLAGPLGDTSALTTAEEAVATAGSTTGWWTSLAWCMLGHARHVSGDPQLAKEAFLTAGGGRDLRRIPPSMRPGQLDTLVNAAIATKDLDSARQWAARAVAEASRLGLRGQHGAALRALAALAEHQGSPREALGHLESAAQEYARSGLRLWEAYALLRAAPLAKRVGHDRRATAMWHRAHRMAAAGGARLLSDLAELIRPQILEGPPGIPAELARAQLTERELEIADLVAEGLSNQAIATQLRLSLRTVETHLSNIYRKADVPSRSVLAILMTRAARGRPAGLV